MINNSSNIFEISSSNIEANYELLEKKYLHAFELRYRHKLPVVIYNACSLPLVDNKYVIQVIPYKEIQLKMNCLLNHEQVQILETYLEWQPLNNRTELAKNEHTKLIQNEANYISARLEQDFLFALNLIEILDRAWSRLFNGNASIVKNLNTIYIELRLPWPGYFEISISNYAEIYDALEERYLKSFNLAFRHYFFFILHKMCDLPLNGGTYCLNFTDDKEMEFQMQCSFNAQQLTLLEKYIEWETQTENTVTVKFKKIKNISSKISGTHENDLVLNNLTELFNTLLNLNARGGMWAISPTNTFVQFRIPLN